MGQRVIRTSKTNGQRESSPAVFVFSNKKQYLLEEVGDTDVELAPVTGYVAVTGVTVH